jgi:hypothetical protein
MAGLLDLFSGRSSDIYGNGLLTPEQRGGLGNIGLLALAGKLGQLAGPSFSPVPDFGAALGQAAGAYGASQEGAGTAALNAILTGQKGRKLEQELDYYKQLGPLLQKLGQGPGADGGTAATPATGSTGGGAAAPPGAGAGGGGGGAGAGAGDAPAIPQSEAVDKARYYARLYGVPEEMFLHQINGENGFKASGTSSAGAQGIAQFMPGTARQYGVDVSNVDSSLDGAARYMRDLYQKTGSWETALRRYLGAATDESVQRVVATNKPYAAAFAAARAGGAPGAAPTAAAPAPAGGGGLLAPTAPNPLSDAEPMVGIPRPRVGPQAAGALPASVPGASPEDTANQILRGWTAGAGGGGPLAVPPGAGTDSYVTPQGPAGDVGPAGPAGPATPRAPLPTMGPAGIELPPMQGPLAAPAPAAAAPAPAPAAPGPGLLAAPGMPAAPALPRVNPAYDAYARNLAVAAGLVKGAGLPDALGPLLEVFKGSPAYKAQQTIAEKTAAQPFEQAQTLFNKQVEIAGVGPIEAAKLPYALAQTYFKAEQDIRTAGPVAAAQNFERIRADNAAKGIITTKDADGNIKLAIDPAALKAVSGATSTVAGDTTRAQQQATADVKAATEPGITRETETQKGFAAQDTSARAQALAAREGLYLLGDARQQLEGAGIFSGALANPKMTLAQYYSSLTGVPNQQLINTQVFLQQAGARSAAILQAGTYGTGTAIGARDLDAANKLANGDNTVDLESIKRVFDLTEKTANRKIEMFNDMIRERDPRSIINPPPPSASRAAGGLDFSKMSLPDLTAAVTRGDLTIDQRKAIDQRFRELGH